MNALLPEHMQHVGIKDLLVGEEAFAVPWAVEVDEDGRCWIRGGYGFHHQPFGTAQMEIVRSNGGFEVIVPRGETFGSRPISPEEHAKWNLLPITKIS